MNHEHRHEPDSGKETTSKTKWVFIGFVAIAAYFLIAEHKAHLSGYLQFWPFLLLLACPLLHMFMHGGHGGHGGQGDDGDVKSNQQRKGVKK
jgi:hypothetical protein